MGIKKAFRVGVYSKAILQRLEFPYTQDDQIRESLMFAGFDPDDVDFIVNNFQVVVEECETIEYLYYHFSLPDEKLIGCFERKPIATGDDFKMGTNPAYYRI